MLPKRLSSNTAPTPIGARNQQIDIQRIVNRDGAGNSVWDTFKSGIWARQQSLTATYKEKAQQNVPEATMRFTLPYLDGITSDMRIVSNGKIYSIEGDPQDPDGARRDLVINCYIRNSGASGVQQ